MLRNMRNRIISVLKNKEGQGMVEYALIIGLVAIVVIAVLVLLGPAIAAKFQSIVDTLTK